MCDNITISSFGESNVDPIVIFTSRPARPRKPFEHRCLRWHVRALMFGFHQPLVTGWWLKNNLEKYEFTNGKDDIPYIVENKICSKPPNHLSSLVKGLCECPFFQILAVSMDWSKGTSTGNHGFSNMKYRGQSMYSGDYLQYDSGSAYAYAYGYGYGMYGGFLTWGYPCSSSISIVFSIINHPFWGSPIYETHIYIYTHHC